MPDELAGGFNLRGTFSQPEPDCLVVEDGLTKTLTLFGVVQRTFKCTARHAHTLRRNADAPALQSTQGNLVAFALSTNQVIPRNTAVVEVDLRRIARMLAQLVFQTGHHIARCVRWHQKRTHALFASALVGHGNDDSDIAILATGYELLDAVNHIPVAVFDCGGLER